jgi:hypothetical protein
VFAAPQLLHTSRLQVKVHATCYVKTSKLRLVAMKQQYCSGRKTRSRKVQMMATPRRRAEQNIGGGGAPTSIFGGGGVVKFSAAAARRDRLRPPTLHSELPV